MLGELALIQRQRDLVVCLEDAGDDTTDVRALLETVLKRQAERLKNLALTMRQYPQSGYESTEGAASFEASLDFKASVATAQG